MTTKEWYATHAEQIKAYNQEYYARNKAALRAKHRDWGNDNSDDRSARAKTWRENNPDRAKEHTARRRAVRSSRLAAAQVMVIPSQKLSEKEAYWGNRCWICKEPFDNDLHAKEWDHVKPIAKGGSHFLANLRPAGKLCNRRKHARWPL
jgi:hypothetical protein